MAPTPFFSEQDVQRSKALMRRHWERLLSGHAEAMRLSHGKLSAARTVSAELADLVVDECVGRVPAGPAAADGCAPSDSVAKGPACAASNEEGAAATEQRVPKADGAAAAPAEAGTPDAAPSHPDGGGGTSAAAPPAAPTGEGGEGAPDADEGEPGQAEPKAGRAVAVSATRAAAIAVAREQCSAIFREALARAAQLSIAAPLEDGFGGSSAAAKAAKATKPSEASAPAEADARDAVPLDAPADGGSAAAERRASELAVRELEGQVSTLRLAQQQSQEQISSLESEIYVKQQQWELQERILNKQVADEMGRANAEKARAAEAEAAASALEAALRDAERASSAGAESGKADAEKRIARVKAEAKRRLQRAAEQIRAKDARIAQLEGRIQELAGVITDCLGIAGDMVQDMEVAA